MTPQDLPPRVFSVNRALKAMKAQTQRETHGPENSSYATLEMVPTVTVHIFLVLGVGRLVTRIHHEEM